MTSRTKRFFSGPDGATVYVTVDGDMVDEIAHGFYGRHGRNTELLYEANPWLADKGIELEAGLVIKIPDAPQETNISPSVRLWD